jgi:hypothetical protein
MPIATGIDVFGNNATRVGWLARFFPRFLPVPARRVSKKVRQLQPHGVGNTPHLAPSMTMKQDAAIALRHGQGRRAVIVRWASGQPPAANGAGAIEEWEKIVRVHRFRSPPRAGSTCRAARNLEIAAGS